MPVPSIISGSSETSVGIALPRVVSVTARIIGMGPIASWHQLGVIGFFCALTFMLLVVAYIFMGVLRSSRYARCDRQRSGLYMVSSTLLCIVLVRLLFAKAGLLAVPEWVALAIALYFYRIAQLGVAQSSPSGIWDSDKRDDSIKLA